MASAYNETLLNEITDFYLKSRDFNGIPMIQLEHNVKLSENELINDLIPMIKQGLVSIVFGDIHPNPHIRALPDEPSESQTKKLSEVHLEHACVYPLRAHLSNVVDPTDYEGSPYILSLALGTPQLEHKAFDLSVLEYYRNDPRYYYKNDDISGSISVHDKYFESKEMAQSDQVLLQSFGFCYSNDLSRAVAVYVRYLSDLTPEHQQIWQAKELSGEYLLHPDYYRMTILGDWGENISIFQAFIEELQIINRIAEIMNRPHLFNQDFTKEESPREFSFLVRPTLKELGDFTLLLDKLLSDNINQGFFRNDISFEREETRKDGKIVVHKKGAIQILDEWIRTHYRTDDWEPIDMAIKTFKSIRSKRQHPAHVVNENTFDQKYFQEQRQIIIEAYEAIRTIRLMLSNYPGCASIEISEPVKYGKIWTY